MWNARLPLALLLSAAWLVLAGCQAPIPAGQTAASPSAATAAASAASAASAPDDTVLFRGGLNHTQVLVHYATNRVPEASATGATGRYKGEVDQALHYGTARVSIPRDHRMGELESPSFWRLEFRPNPDKHVMLLSVDPSTRDGFYAALSELQASEGNARKLVFVHGYNVSFDDAARRAAQISYDIGFTGQPMAFSWPSRAALTGYFDDEKAIAASVPAMLTFFRELAEQSGPGEIYVLAHSMGNRGTTLALAQLFQERPELRDRFRHILLMAPDIDAEVFKRDIAPVFARQDDQITLYASANDKALQASRLVHGGPRLGQADPIAILPGIESIDASQVSTDLLGHSYYAEGSSVVSDLVEVVSERGPAASRSWLEAITNAIGRYFRFKPSTALPAPRATGPASHGLPASAAQALPAR